ncbi:MAG TPA: hypothetical protein DCP28_18920 [Cytophagales bacterium]|nr:hypothetical protein [Cytophagales bacterium]
METKNGFQKHMEIRDAKDSDKTFTVMVNPTSYSVQHTSCHSNQQPIGSTVPNLHFNKIKPSNLKIELLFDSTGSLSIASLNPAEGIMNQIDAFMAMVYVPDTKNSTLKPRRVQLVWGALNFEGSLTSVNIAYSHFDGFGNPIRARAMCLFAEDKEARQNRAADNTNANPVQRESFNDDKHLVNGLQRYGAYLQVLQKQPYERLPDTLRGVTTGLALDLITTG